MLQIQSFDPESAHSLFLRQDTKTIGAQLVHNMMGTDLWTQKARIFGRNILAVPEFSKITHSHSQAAFR
jgi:hypothetical protein